jgi:hypothetical protein
MSGEFLLMFLFQGELQDALCQLLVRIIYSHVQRDWYVIFLHTFYRVETI